MTPGLVSVIIPTYNRRRLVCDAVESALAQTYSPVEVLVVDNGSNDGTGDELKKYGERIRYFFMPKPGLSPARNFGIGQAGGEFVAFLDNDDLWDPRKLEKQMPLFKNPSVVLAYTDAHLFHEAGRSDGLYSALYPPKRGPILEPLFRGPFMVCSSLVVRSEALAKAGLFDPRYQIAEEYDLMMRLVPYGEMDYVEEPLTWYRFHGGNDSRQRRTLMWSEALEISEAVLARHPELKENNPDLWHDRFAEIYFHLAVSLWREGGYAEGLFFFKKALRHGFGRVMAAAFAWGAVILKSRWPKKGGGN